MFSRSFVLLICLIFLASSRIFAAADPRYETASILEEFHGYVENSDITDLVLSYYASPEKLLRMAMDEAYRTVAPDLSTNAMAQHKEMLAVYMVESQILRGIASDSYAAALAALNEIFGTSGRGGRPDLHKDYIVLGMLPSSTDTTGTQFLDTRINAIDTDILLANPIMLLASVDKQAHALRWYQHSTNGVGGDEYIIGLPIQINVAPATFVEIKNSFKKAVVASVGEIAAQRLDPVFTVADDTRTSATINKAVINNLDLAETVDYSAKVSTEPRDQPAQNVDNYVYSESDKMPEHTSIIIKDALFSMQMQVITAYIKLVRNGDFAKLYRMAKKHVEDHYHSPSSLAVKNFGIYETNRIELQYFKDRAKYGEEVAQEHRAGRLKYADVSKQILFNKSGYYVPHQLKDSWSMRDEIQILANIPMAPSNDVNRKIAGAFQQLFFAKSLSLGARLPGFFSNSLQLEEDFQE